jgi:cytidine deaminase
LVLWQVSCFSHSLARIEASFQNKPLGKYYMSLFQNALAIRENAHAPYSRFKVGAAVRSASGKVFVGCNVENSAYPEGTCAEAGAISAMIAAGEKRIEQVCVVADSPVPIAPCGGCRQKIAEFANPEVEVILADLEGETKRVTVGELLPHAFSNSHLPGE